MKQYPIALCFWALFVAACTDESNNAGASAASRSVEAAKADSGNAEGMKPLKLVLPELRQEGTPVPVVLPNIDPNRMGANPAVSVPEGVANIALGKHVTASDDFPLVGEVSMVTDGNKSAVDFVELADGLQWVQIDLGKQSEIFAVAVWHHHLAWRAYKDVVVRISDDPEFKSGAATVFNNDHDNSAGFGAGSDLTWEETFEGRLIPMKKPVKARYVRLYSNGNTTNDTNAYVEVEVYGR